MQTITRNTWTDTDRETAFTDWLASGSLRDTATSLGIPAGTVAQWSTVGGWKARRDDIAAELEASNRQQALAALSSNRSRLLDILLELAEGADRDSVRLDAVRLALSLLGIFPAQLRNATVTPHNRPGRTTESEPIPLVTLPPDQALRLAQRFHVVGSDDTSAATS